MSVKQYVSAFQSSEYNVNGVSNDAVNLRKWQWWGDANHDHLLTVDDLPNSPDKWNIIDSRGDGHCFYNTLHRFLLENRLYTPARRQKTYETGQKGKIPDREQMRTAYNTASNTQYEPPILFLRRKVLESIMNKGIALPKSTLDAKDVKKKYLDVLQNRGFFIQDSEGSIEATDIIRGFNDAQKFQETLGWVNFGQVAVTALVLKINIIVYSQTAKKWTPFYAHQYDYDEDEKKNRDTLREEPVCFMNFTGAHFQLIVPLTSPKQSKNNHKAYLKNYKKRYTDKMHLAKEVLTSLERKEKEGDFKRIPLTANTEEKKLKWVLDRLRNQKWDTETFLKRNGEIQKDELLCKHCKIIRHEGYPKCSACHPKRLPKGTVVHFSHDGVSYNGRIEGKYKDSNNYKIKRGIRKQRDSVGQKAPKYYSIPRKDITIQKEEKNGGDSEEPVWKDAMTEFTTTEKNTNGTEIARNIKFNKIIRKVFQNLLTRDVKGDGYCMLHAVNALTGNIITIANLQKWAIEEDDKRGDSPRTEMYTIDDNDKVVEFSFVNDLEGTVSNLSSHWLPVLARKCKSRFIIFTCAHNTNTRSTRVEEYPGQSTGPDSWAYDQTHLLYNTAHYWPLKFPPGHKYKDEKQLMTMRKDWYKLNSNVM